MKRFIHLLILLPLFLLGINSLHAQRLDYTNDSGWDIGFGLGGSYQQSDIRNFSGGGFTFLVGNAIYQKENAFWSLDWRFRFLGGQNTAFDDRMKFNDIDSTYYYSNVRYTHFNYDLEFVLTLNRLRERTGIIVSASGGAGVTHNITSFDLVDDSDLLNPGPYDFSSINVDGNDSRATIYEDLKALSDDDFETIGINHGCISPTVGFYLGYQFTPHFSMGIEHKINYFLEEGNTIIGADIDGITDNGSLEDKNHYTGLLLKWDIGYGHTPAPCHDPVVNFTVREANSHYASHQLDGTITNVTNPAYITVEINGVRDNNFYFDKSSHTISSAFNLLPGKHVITVTARNDCGQDSHSVEVFVENPCYPPEVDLVVSETNINNFTHIINANITNIHSRSDIRLTIDGNTDISFNYNPANQTLTDKYNFAPGYHTITLTARNECGRDSESVEVFIEAPCKIPVANISVIESANPNYTHELKGNIANINNKDNIKVLVDGVVDYSFQFESGTNIISNFYKFAPGTHTITVIAKNECGQDTEYVQAVVESPCELPIVEFSVYESNQSNYTHVLNGVIHNINNRSDIKVYVDGVNDYSFQFNTANNQIYGNYNFDPGSHNITVIAYNECGEDREITEFIIENPCNVPEIKLSVNEINYTNYTHQLNGTVFNVENRNNITVFVDGKRDYSFQYNESTHQIISKYNFEPGTHTITVSAKNECGDDFESIQVVIDAPCEVPTVDFRVSETTNSNYTHYISGSVKNVENKNNITITVDGVIDNSFVYKATTGDISDNYKLEPGIHMITVFAKNECGEDSQSIQVIVDDPCDPPVVDFKIVEIIHSNFTHELTGVITNVKNKSDITLLVDGRPDNSFQYVPSNNEISSKLKLTPGNHTITVKAKNDCGEDVVSVQVYIESPCDPPVVNFSVIEIDHANFTHEMSGTVTNVQNKSEITVLVDGVEDNSFQYIPNTNALSGKFKLGKGSHVITIIANNDCGQDTESFTVTVETPCHPPVIDFQMVEIIHANFTHEMSGTVINVQNKSDITVLVDGVEDNSFQYIPNTNALSGKFKLEGGNHVITIIARNECGEDSESINLNIDVPCDLPVVNFSVNEMNHQTFTHEMTGTVTNVQNKSNITVLVNGDEDNSFQYIPNTNALSGKFKLESGSNTITVIASNECGEDSESITISIEAPPCDPPVINFNVNEIDHATFTHEMSGTITNVQNKSDITVLVDGQEDNSFQYIPNTNALSGKFKLEGGNHVITIIARNDCGEDTESVTVTVETPCDPPVINFNISEIDHAIFTHEMSGSVTNVQNKSDITIMVDGQEDNSFQYVPNTNALSGNFKLEPGNHTITVIATNDCGQDTESVQITVEDPCIPPVVSISMSETSAKSINFKLSGTVTNVENKSQITVRVDNKADNSFQYDHKTNGISSQYNFDAGNHTVIVKAKNDCGEDSDTVTVTVEEPCDPPVINFNVTESDANNFTHEMSGTVTNVKNKSEITVTVDGEEDNSFQYIPNTNALSGSFNLEPGTHTITVSVENDCGQDSESVQVTIEEPCDPPVINFNVTESDANNFTHEMSGTVTNVKNKSEITVTVDGEEDNSFQYIPNTNALSGSFNLEPGTHTITVSVKNDCGQDSESIQVTVEEPCEDPIVNFSVFESGAKSTTHQLNGTVINVQSKNEITVTIDGNTFNSFQFIPGTNVISADLSLEAGNHTITVKAQNDCGEDSQSTDVNVEDPCDPPTVNLYINESSATNSTHTISGTTTNIDNKNQITITIDGNNYTAFQFVNGQISGSLNLDPGTHSIKVTVKNDCGQDSDTQQASVEEPCDPPSVNITLSETSESGYTHVMNGSVSNIDSKNNITISVDGSTDNVFTFSSSTGHIDDKYNFDAGTHTITVSVQNECGQDSDSEQVTVEEEACGPRINPGNAEWEFCLVTPSGTYNRSSLDNSGWSYSGSASSLFFKATAGGGDAIVNGNPYSISSGKYYLFTGNLKVNVSTSNPGSMGLWSVCIEADKTPQSGIGNGRPTSPCEDTDDGKNGDTNIRDNNNGGTQINVGGRDGRTNTINTNSGRNNSSSTNNSGSNNSSSSGSRINSSSSSSGKNNSSSSGTRTNTSSSSSSGRNNSSSINSSSRNNSSSTGTRTNTSSSSSSTRNNSSTVNSSSRNNSSSTGTRTNTSSSSSNNKEEETEETEGTEIKVSGRTGNRTTTTTGGRTN